MNSTMLTLPKSLQSLAELCQAEAIIGDKQTAIQRFCSLEDLQPDAISFISNEQLLKRVNHETDTAYIVKPQWSEQVRLGLVHNNPTQAFRLLLDAFFTPRSLGQTAQTAVVSAQASIGSNVSIGHHSVIESGVIVGDNCIIGNHCTIARDSVIGKNTNIGHGVVIQDNCQIGHHCVIADGAVIGGQGFGFSFEGGSWYPVRQIGRVIIGNRVHIGNNSCIDRGAINDTVIADNVIIDNLVHIAHNVHVGAHSAMAAGVGIAGSTRLGKHCLLGGQVGVVGHITVADGVQVNGGARILQSIDTAGTYAGSFTALPATQWNRMTVYMKRLESLFRKRKKS